MKSFVLAICFGGVISFLSSCKKDSNEKVKTFDYEKAAGIWVPYELTDESGTIHQGPFTANSLFGIYAESVQLNGNKTFIPVTWINKDTFGLKTDESGNFEYLSNNKLRFTGGVFDFECDLIKFEDDDLWLKMFDVLWKFKRQL